MSSQAKSKKKRTKVRLSNGIGNLMTAPACDLDGENSLTPRAFTKGQSLLDIKEGLGRGTISGTKFRIKVIFHATPGAVYHKVALYLH